MTPEQQLKIISKAWGRQDGYCFFPWIDGDANNREERIRSYNEGPAFKWPEDRDKIIDHMAAHTKDDLYWCPSLFEKKQRKMELAMDEHALWADLDEVDPSDIEDYPPTIAWESSPGRYQALWLITGGRMGASWMGNENQRMTYYLGADVSGWDTTQLLRIPGWDNHKFEYRAQREGHPAPGRLLWQNGRRYQPDDFDELPEVQSAVGAIADILESEIDHIDRHEVWGRVRLKVSKRVRDLVGARETAGDRSSVLWEIERELADAGCSVVEIVAIVRSTVWNKFEGRQDELRRLATEASKALAMRGEKSGDESLEESEDIAIEPMNLFGLMETVKQPEWLIKDILTVGGVGFIAGQPKSFKSWVALDMAMSVATGLPFLDHFPVRRPGPVLYVQEEDPLPMIKSRVAKIWPGKQADKVKINGDGQVEWHPPSAHDRPDINAVVMQGVVISDPGWQSALDEVLEKGYPLPNGDSVRYALVIMDPLMMMAGDVEENRAQEMTNKIFKPLKTLARKHQIAMQVVHHMKKSDPARGERGGQLMLGSVANHAWSEDSLYIRHGAGGNMVVERESKNTVSGNFKLGGLRNRQWTPTVIDDRMGDESDEPQSPQALRGSNVRRRPQQSPQSKSRAYKALKERGGKGTTGQIAEVLGVSVSGTYKQLMRLKDKGLVDQYGQSWSVK